ncbi:hypothetical protein ACP4OV_024932 [Aristida adscensionis]
MGVERNFVASAALLMLLGASAVVRSAAGRPSPPPSGGERALAGFLLWLLGLLLLSSHRVRPFPGAAAKLRRFFTGRCLV